MTRDLIEEDVRGKRFVSRARKYILENYAQLCADEEV